MAVSGQDKLDGFVREIFLKIETTESSGFSVYKGFLYLDMAVSGQDRLDGFVGEMFPKTVTTFSIQTFFFIFRYGCVRPRKIRGFCW